MTKPSIAIIDCCCPIPYDSMTIASRALGGTEASIIRVAAALSSAFDITVYQHCRHAASQAKHGVRYRGFSSLKALAQMERCDHTIVINSPKVLRTWGRYGRQSSLLLWLHNYPGRRSKQLGRVLREADATVVTVSQTHRKALLDFIARYDGDEFENRIVTIYNPVDVGRRKTASLDPDQLAFLSSPHKGLDEVIERFEYVKAQRRSVRLVICDPGYQRLTARPRVAGVQSLGELPHSLAMDMLRRSFCLFYPQTGFAETFGLVFAEANAVGTPVLAHEGLGSVNEIVADRRQLVDARDPAAVMSRLENWWRFGRPIPESRPEFQIDSVAGNWMRLLKADNSEWSLRAVPTRGSGSECIAGSQYLSANERSRFAVNG